MAVASPLCSRPLILKGLVDQVDDLVTAYLPTCLLLLVGSTCNADTSPPFPLPFGPPNTTAPSHTPAMAPFQATTESLFSGHTAWDAGS